jgi:hypothetical protein
MTYAQIAWLPLCAGLSAVGIVLSYLTGLSGLLFFVSGALRGRALSRARRAGGRDGETATGAEAVTGTGTGAGAGIGGGRRTAPQAAAGREAAKAPGKTAAGNPAPRPVERAKEPAAADDFSDIEDILKRRGIS